MEAVEMTAAGRQQLRIYMCGKEYRWPEPCRRDRRAMAARLYQIQDAMGLGDDVSEQKRIAGGLQMMNAALDFFYEFNAQMAQDREAIEEALEGEIAEALQAVSVFILRPFAEGAVSPNQKNGESENLSNPNGGFPGTSSTENGPSENTAS